MDSEGNGAELRKVPSPSTQNDALDHNLSLQEIPMVESGPLAQDSDVPDFTQRSEHPIIITQPPEHDDSQAETSHDHENNHVQNPDLSAILPPSFGARQFATPSKNLPPLKDIDSITTPKSFGVAKDPPGRTVSGVQSSPVGGNTSFQLERLAEAEEDVLDPAFNDTFEGSVKPRAAENADSSSIEIAANFLAIETDVVLDMDPDLMTKLASKARKFHGLQSELSHIKLDQEHLTQSHHQRLTKLQEEVELLSDSNRKLTSENEALQSTNRSLEESLSETHQQLDEYIQEQKDHQDANHHTAGLYAVELDKKDHEILRLNESLDRLTRSNIEQDQRISELVKDLDSAANEKFKVKLDLSKVSHELSYLRDQKDWFEKQLQILQEKYTELIKLHETETLKNSSKIASLVAENESLKTMKQSFMDQTAALQMRFDEAQNKIEALDSQLEALSSKLASVTSSKDDTIELLNLQLRESSERIQQLESYSDEIKFSTAQSIESLQSEIDDKDAQIVTLEEMLKRTEDALSVELHKVNGWSQLAKSTENILDDGDLDISLSALYAEFVHLKKELVLEKSQKESLAAQLQHFVQELELRKPAIANYREKIEHYEASLSDLFSKLEEVRGEKLESEKEGNRLRTKLTSYEVELNSMKQLTKDLGRQLCYYLIHSKIREGDENPLTTQERKVIDQILAKSGNDIAEVESDTDQLITERLLGFASVIELQKKNSDLLVSVRLLAKQLEEKDSDSNGDEASAVEEARDAILTLQAELDSVTLKYETALKEKELLGSLEAEPFSKPNETTDPKMHLVSKAKLESQIQELERSLSALHKQSADKIQALHDKLTQARAESQELQLKLVSAKHSSDLASSRQETNVQLLTNAQREVEAIRSEADFWKSQSLKQENLLVQKTNEVRDVESRIRQLSSQTRDLEVEKQVWIKLEQNMNNVIASLQSDKNQLQNFVTNLQKLLKERDDASADLSQRLLKSVENYQNLQQKIDEKEEKIHLLTVQAELAIKSQNDKLQQVNELTKRLSEVKSQLKDNEGAGNSSTKKSQSNQYAVDSTLNGSGHESHRIESNEQSDSEKKRLEAEIRSLREELEKQRAVVSSIEARSITSQDQVGEHQALPWPTDKDETAGADLGLSVDAKATLKSRLDAACQELEKAKQESALLSSSLKAAEALIEEQKRSIIDDKMTQQDQLETLQNKLQELKYQYDLAINQIELQNQSDNSPEQSAEENLRQVLGHLRVEKEASELKAATLEELLRQKESQIVELSAELNSCRAQIERTQVMKLDLNKLDDDQRFNDQLEQINVLRESNATLRNENSRWLEKIKSLEALLESQQASHKQASDSASLAQNLSSQEQSLLREENERLKAQLVNNDEVKTLLQRFENLKSEFKTKLMGHRARNKELEKSLNELREELKASQELTAQLQSRKDNTQEVEALTGELQSVKAAKTELEQKYLAEIENIKTQHENQLKEFKKSCAEQMDAAVKQAKASGYTKELVEAEIKKHVDEERSKLKDEFELQKSLTEQSTSEGALGKLREELAQESELKIKQLTEEFERKLVEERERATKAVDKKYEFKLKVLNRKLERLEKKASSEAGSSEIGASAPPSNAEVLRGPPGPALAPSSPLSHLEENRKRSLPDFEDNAAKKPKD